MNQTRKNGQPRRQVGIGLKLAGNGGPIELVAHPNEILDQSKQFNY